jgi:hypothetical protein
MFLAFEVARVAVLSQVWLLSLGVYGVNLDETASQAVRFGGCTVGKF